MVTGVVAACAVVVVGALILLAVRWARLRSDRRLDAVLLEIDGHLKAISTSVGEAIDRFADARSDAPPLFLTLDFDVLVDSVVAEAAARTAADAVVLQVEGPGGRPVVASLRREGRRPAARANVRATRHDPVSGCSNRLDLRRDGRAG